MCLLKKTLVNGLMVLGLSLGLSISAIAITADDIYRSEVLEENGDPIQQAAIGAIYQLGTHGVPQDYAKSFYWSQKSAERGNAQGQFQTGAAYYYGKGVRQDYAKAFYWSQKSAKQGNVYAQVVLGTMYGLGHGVRQNKSQAKGWYGKACDGGFQSGCDGYRLLNK